MIKYFSKAPLNVKKMFLGDCAGDAGGIVTFVGTPRATAEGRRVIALEYEAYEDMARPLLDEILFEAQVRWSLEGVL